MLVLAAASCACADEVPGYRRLVIKGDRVNLRSVPEVKASRTERQADDGEEFIGASWPVNFEWRLIIFTIGTDGSLTFTPCYVYEKFVDEQPLRDGDAARIAATEYGSLRGAPGTFGEIFGASWHDTVRKFGTEVPYWDSNAGRTIGMDWSFASGEYSDGSLTDDWGWDVGYRSSGLTFSFQLANDDPFGRVRTTVWLREGAPEVLGVKLGRTTRAEVEASFSDPDETNTFDDGRTLVKWDFPLDQLSPRGLDPLGGDVPDSMWLWFDPDGVVNDGGFRFSSPETKIWAGLLRR